MRQTIFTHVRFIVRSKVAGLLRRELTYEVSPGWRIQIPPEHKLPLLQKVHPTYDRYFLKFFAKVSEQSPNFVIVDVGANVGDTAVAVRSVAPAAEIICVEGSQHFLKYLMKNLGSDAHVRVVPSFVSVGGGRFEFSRGGGTGRLETIGQAQPSTRETSDSEIDFVEPAEVVRMLHGDSLAVWKSDTDGHDVAILLKGYDEIVQRCDVLWFEMQMLGRWSDHHESISTLFEKLAELDREIMLFDNFGRLMFRATTALAPRVVPQLQRWVSEQTEAGDLAVNYFDVWVMPAGLANTFEGSLRD